MGSADFSQFVVITANEATHKTKRDKSMLGAALRFVGSYAYVDFHHGTRACPSYPKGPWRFIS